MKLTTRSRIAALFLVILTLVTTATPAFAASSRVRCEVRSSRLRIQVDGLGMILGQTYYAVVTNTVTNAVVQTQEGKESLAITRAIDLDFDSKAGPNDLDSFVDVSFASRNQKISVVIKNAANDSVVTQPVIATCLWKR